MLAQKWEHGGLQSIEQRVEADHWPLFPAAVVQRRPGMKDELQAHETAGLDGFCGFGVTGIAGLCRDAKSGPTRVASDLLQPGDSTFARS